MEPVVQEVDREDTLPLRQSVLRPQQSIEELAREDLDCDDMTCFGVLDPTSEELLSTGTVFPQDPTRDLASLLPSDGPFWRLRGMATVREHRGEGIGRAVLTTCCDHVRKSGGNILWCNARKGAVPFYLRAGFVTAGKPFTIVGGEHIVMWHRLGAVSMGNCAVSMGNS